jgi:hypothetical protein
MWSIGSGRLQTDPELGGRDDGHHADRGVPDGVADVPQDDAPLPLDPGPGGYVAFTGHGQVAQMVEQGTENPRVGGSSPSLATSR